MLGLVIAMFVIALLVPGLLVMLTRSQQLATTSPDWDEGIQARAELAELFGSVDPIGQCASPVGGPEAAFRDTCFREERIVGASLVEAPSLPAAESPVPCWLTIQETGPRQRQCLVLEGGSDELECVDPLVGPCLEVLSEVTGEPVMVDRYGGGRFLVRSWDEEPTDPCFQREVQRLFGVPFTADVPDVPFLPSPACFPEASVSDRLVYHGVEWVCLRWRHPYDGDLNRDGDTDDAFEWAAHEWVGECPDPADPTETWPPDGGLPFPATAGVSLVGSALVYEHSVGDRISAVEVLVCVASDHAARLRGESHCAVDRMRFNLAGDDGDAPPTPIVPAIALHPDIANGLPIMEEDSGSLPVRLLTAPSDDVTLTVTAPAGITVSPMTLTFRPDNWDIPQTLTVTAADDTDRDDEDVTLTLTAASTDTDYDDLATSVEVTVTDDDEPALRTDPDTVTVDESGMASFTVTLNGQPSPSGEVTATIASSDAAAATVSPSSLSFPSSETTVTVTVTGANDDNASHETVTLTLTTSVTFATDHDDYGGLTGVVTVEVTDDDTPALVLSAAEVTVDEDGTATVDVSLATEPSESVTVTVASVDPAAATVTPASLTFTSVNWSTAQTVTITGTDDEGDDDETVTVTLTASGADYTTLTAALTVTVTDDDRCALVESLTPAQLSDVESATVQGAWLTDRSLSERTNLAVDWTNNGSLTIPAESLVGVTLAGSPAIAITDNTLLDSIRLGSVTWSQANRYLGYSPGEWVTEAEDNGSFTIAGDLVESVVVSAECVS